MPERLEEELCRPRTRSPACSFMTWQRLPHCASAAWCLPRCAGFSLGEVAALTFAGAFDTRASFELVCERAALMAMAAERHPGGMRAVIKLDAAQVEGLAKQAGEDCWPVNYNSPQQTVVAGAPDVLQALDVLVKEAGGRP
ncbi:MAG: ACP S-malonyltransferase [Collinsella sp.]